MSSNQDKQHRILVFDDSADNIDILISLLKDDYKELIHQADEMLYKSKNAGRNQVSGIDMC